MRISEVEEALKLRASNAALLDKTVGGSSTYEYAIHFTAKHPFSSLSCDVKLILLGRRVKTVSNWFKLPIYMTRHFNINSNETIPGCVATPYWINFSCVLFLVFSPRNNVCSKTGLHKAHGIYKLPIHY